MTRLLESLFNIRPEEQRQVLLMFLYSTFMIAAAFIIARTVASTLFLKRIDPKYLPLTYVASAFFVSLFSMGYARIGDKLRRDRTIVYSFIVFTVVVLGLRGLLEVSAQSLWVMGTLYVFVEVMGTLAIIQFWTFANEVFTTRQAKRIFAFIGAGGTVAGIVFGIVVRSTVKIIGAPNLLFMIAVLFVVCMCLVRQLGRIFALQLAAQKPPQRANTDQDEPRNLLQDFKTLFQSSHLLTITASLVITSIVVIIVDYQFMIAARASFADENALAAFFGSFYIYTGVVAFMFQFFVTGRLLQKYGILAALLFLPGLLLLMSIGMLLVSAPRWVLTAATGAKGSDNVVRYSINNSTFQLLYLPVPAEFRAKAKALIDGIMKPLANGVSGLLILVLVMFMSPQRLSIVVIVLISFWILLVFRARRQYMLSLADTIRRKKLDLYGSTLPVDESTVKALANALQGESERNAYNALELLNAVPDKDWNPLVARLLHSGSPGLRRRAVEHLGSNKNDQYAEQIFELFDDPDTEVRATAFDAYCMIREERGMMDILPFVKDADPLIKSTVVACMIQYGGIDGILMAADELKFMLTSPDWHMRVAGAKVLEKIQVRQFYQPLEKLLYDENVHVQIEAIKAAGGMKSPLLLPALTDKLTQRKTARAAGLALAGYGEDAVGYLASMLDDIDNNRMLRVYIPKIMRTIGTQQSLDILMKNIDTDNDQVRHSVIDEMAHMAKYSRHLVFDVQKIMSCLETETRNYFQQITILADIGSKIEPRLLGEVLQLKAQKTAQRLLALLSVIYPDQPIEPISLGLKSPDPSIRANSIELLDNILEGDKKHAILAVFEDDTVEKKHKFGNSHFKNLRQESFLGWLRYLLDDDNPWLVACTVYQIGVSQIDELADHLRRILKEKSDVLVLETTHLALKLLTQTEIP